MLTAKFVNYNQLKHGFSPSFSSKQINKADCIYAQYDICAVGIAWTDGWKDRLDRLVQIDDVTWITIVNTPLSTIHKMCLCLTMVTSSNYKTNQRIC